MNKQPERSVKEIVEEFTGRFYGLLDDAMIENVDEIQKQYFNMHFKPLLLKYLGKQLTKALQAERQRCEEMVEEAEKRGAEQMQNKISKEIGKRIDEWENSEDWDGTLNDGLYSLAHYVQNLTQPNHEK